MNKDAIHDLQMLVWNSSNAFADMRLLVEGAITLYEDDAESICSLTLDQTDKHAAIAYDTIGTALYGLREKIRDMQTEYMMFSVKPPTPPAETACSVAFRLPSSVASYTWNGRLAMVSAMTLTQA